MQAETATVVYDPAKFQPEDAVAAFADDTHYKLTLDPETVADSAKPERDTSNDFVPPAPPVPNSTPTNSSASGGDFDLELGAPE